MLGLYSDPTPVETATFTNMHIRSMNQSVRSLILFFGGRVEGGGSGESDRDLTIRNSKRSRNLDTSKSCFK